MSFDEIIDRTGTHCAKWDKMESLYGLSPDEGLAMWVADMDFRSAEVIQQAARKFVDHGVYGYFGDDRAYKEAVAWWMSARHGWPIEPDWIFTTHGIVNAVGLVLDTWTRPGDGVVLMTPVYHAFARVIRTAGREVVECRMPQVDGRYVPDFDAWDAQMTGKERAFILCSPHNPGGRVWTRDELHGIAEFCKRHDLLLISDEIHHDLVMPGHKHVPMAVAEPGITDRLVMLTAASKTFNIAGLHTGNVIIPDPVLREAFGIRMGALGISPNSLGVHMTTAAYSPAGAAWVDELVTYLDGNRRVFDAGIAAIPGLASMPLQATYLAWVDFAGTGMDSEQILRRVEGEAKIATNHGSAFGAGGESFLRFNLGTQRARIVEAVERLQQAFADLQ